MLLLKRRKALHGNQRTIENLTVLEGIGLSVYGLCVCIRVGGGGVTRNLQKAASPQKRTSEDDVSCTPSFDFLWLFWPVHQRGKNSELRTENMGPKVSKVPSSYHFPRRHICFNGG
jgi:hypothetical protein